jgi:hypothetical protein
MYHPARKEEMNPSMSSIIASRCFLHKRFLQFFSKRFSSPEKDSAHGIKPAFGGRSKWPAGGHPEHQGSDAFP